MGNDKKLSGKSLDVTMLNLALYGELDPGVPRMSPEQRNKAFEYLGSKLRKPLSKSDISQTNDCDFSESFKKMMDDGN